MADDFDPVAYEEARDALGEVSDQTLQALADSADTPAKAAAVRNEIAERGRRG